MSEMFSFEPDTSLLQSIFRIALGLFLLYTGTGHLTFARQEFLAQVPLWIPIGGDVVVVLSGVVELLLGFSLVFLGRYQVIVGWVVALFFVAIFPGNISQYVNGIDGFGLDTDRARFIRLFFQPVLILWVLWSTGAWEAYQQTRKQSPNEN